MSLNILIPIIAVTTCYQYALFFLALWRKHRDQNHLLTFCLFALSIGTMTATTLYLQRFLAAGNEFFGLQVYRGHLVSVDFSVATLIAFSYQITNRQRPAILSGKRLVAAAILFAIIVFSPSVLHIPARGVSITDFDDACAGPLFFPFVGTMFAGTCGAIGVLWRSVRIRRSEMSLHTDGAHPFFGDNILFLVGVMVFIPAGIYDIALAMNWMTEIPGEPNARAISLMILCALTGQMLVNGIFEANRRKQLAETQAQSYLDTMSYAAHQVRGHADSILWRLRDVLTSGKHEPSSDGIVEGIPEAIEDTTELRRIFNSMLMAARDAAGQPMNIGPRRFGNISEYVENICQKRLNSAGSHSDSNSPPEFCFHSEISQDVLFSKDALQHILAILVDNAVKYSPNGIHVKVNLWTEQDMVVMSVADRGIGITPGFEEKLFVPFGRGDAEERNGHIPGNGIGLPFARRVAEAHGGTLKAESGGHEMGSLFTLRFPLEMEEA